MFNRRNAVLSVVMALAFLGTLAATPAQSATPDRYAAIAYSPATGSIGYAAGHYSLAEAQAAALYQCNAFDAKVVVWVRNGHAALALGDSPGVYGWGWASTESEARALALIEAAKRTTNVYIAATVFTGS